jgi:hypothetical protein
LNTLVLFEKLLHYVAMNVCPYITSSAHPRRGADGLQPLRPPKLNLKNTNFVDIMISKALCDFHFSQNQPLKLAED